MAILKEFRCESHGDFESKFAVCPHGCLEVERVILTAPATVSRRTKNIDSTLNGIAKDNKLSDISNKNGTLASSVDQFQSQTPKVLKNMGMGGMDVNSAIQQRMAQIGSGFGGNFIPGQNGSFWRDNSTVQQGQKARITGKLENISGIPNNVNVSTIVQSACDASGKVIR
jgi:hypothetical protein